MWRFVTGDQVKCSPVQDPSTGLVWIGSHDGNIYALDIYKKICFVSICTSRPVFATPALHSTHQRVYVGGEDGKLYAIRADGSEIIWTRDLLGPVFSSPIVDTENDIVFVADVKHNVYAFSLLGVLLWKRQTLGPIFSSLLLCEFRRQETAFTEKVILFGCHDNFVYCMNRFTGALKWKTNLDSAIFSSPSAIRVREVSAKCIDTVIAVCTTKGKIQPKQKLSRKLGNFIYCPRTAQY